MSSTNPKLASLISDISSESAVPPEGGLLSAANENEADALISKATSIFTADDKLSVNTQKIGEQRHIGPYVSKFYADRLIERNMLRPTAVITKPGSNQKIPLPPGLVALIAPTMWGKTTAVHTMVKSTDRRLDLIDLEGNLLQPLLINFNEPYSESLASLGHDAVIVESDEDVESILTESLTGMNAHPLVVLDGMRPWVYRSTGGGTAEGGLDAMLPVFLTRMSNYFAKIGRTVLATLNPMIDTDIQDEKYKLLVNRLKASLPLVLVGSDNRSVTYDNRVTGENNLSFSFGNLKDGNDVHSHRASGVAAHSALNIDLDDQSEESFSHRKNHPFSTF